MDIDKALAEITTDLTAIITGVPPVELQEFTKAEFFQYALEQIKKAGEEKYEELRKSRLQHLLTNLQDVQKNGFQDTETKKVPVYSGKLSVESQTAWKERSEKDISPAAAAASTAPGPLGFAQKDRGGLTSNDLMHAMAQLLSTELAKDEDTDQVAAANTSEQADTSVEASAKTSEEVAEETVESEGAAEEVETAVEDNAESVAETTEKKTQKKQDPWGNSLDFNGSDASDDGYGESSIRFF